MLSEDATPGPVGAVLHSPWLYDLTVWLATLGRDRALRERLVDLGRLTPGEAILDVGCGTGTLAIAAKRRVGSTGEVHGVDASPEMIARARSKARGAGVEVAFQNAAAQALPFPSATFDVALSTLMLHHLSQSGRRQLAMELQRIVKPGGRVLVVDFARSTRQRRGPLRHFHHGHGAVDLQGITALLAEPGFNVIESGPVGMKDLQFVLAAISLTA